MNFNDLSDTIGKITMPEEMKARILEKCLDGKEESIMSKKAFKKPVAAAVTAVLCFGIITGTTVLARSDKLQGFFKDKTRNNTVIGTTYEDAGDEISFSIEAGDGSIIVHAEIAEPQKIPYMTFEGFSISSYTISDENGNTVIGNKSTDSLKLESGKANFVISVDGLNKGRYVFKADSFTGSKKADQPLEIHGNWSDCNTVFEIMPDGNIVVED